ncbi:MAG: helix-turn-helix domain-containing protein, partial [Deltaproteobacteria bacterium]
MIDPQKRSAIYYLHTQGMPIRQIAKNLRVDRKTVHKIILQNGEISSGDAKRSDKIVLDNELVASLHGQCGGYAKRIHEKLEEEHGKKIGYSTLT